MFGLSVPQFGEENQVERTVAKAATATALAVTLGVASASWVLALREMKGMDMGTATRLGSFGFFMAVWLAMMAAMMLPGAAPATLRRGHAGGGARVMPLFVGSYLAVWAVLGAVVYELDRPHGTSTAGAVVIAAGAYELTPLKRYFRQSCRETVRSGFDFGVYCVGSSIGLMLIMVVLGVMNVTWMIITTVVVFAQKVLPAKAVLDVPVALAIVGFGVLIAVAPSTVTGPALRFL